MFPTTSTSMHFNLYFVLYTITGTIALKDAYLAGSALPLLHRAVLGMCSSSTRKVTLPRSSISDGLLSSLFPLQLNATNVIHDVSGDVIGDIEVISVDSQSTSSETPINEYTDDVFEDDMSLTDRLYNFFSSQSPFLFIGIFVGLKIVRQLVNPPKKRVVPSQSEDSKNK